MKNTPQNKVKAKRANGLRPEYRFDYTKAKPNRFAGRAQPGSVAVLLDPDVARVFQRATSVNAVLRALVATMPSRRAPAERALRPDASGANIRLGKAAGRMAERRPTSTLASRPTKRVRKSAETAP